VIDVARRAAAPASLAANDRYDGEDVVAALYADFLGKCYLCETKVQPGTFTIDHRKPQGERQFPALRCAWTNLFPTCNTHRCNERRRKLYPDEGLLDPGSGHRVEERVAQRLERPSAVLASARARFVFEAVQKDDAAAVNTAEELARIHDGTGASPPAQRTAGALRGAILLHVELIARKLVELHGAEGDQREARTRELAALFSRRAPYTMLVRSCFAGSPVARALFDDSSP
jgi:hypothetical protein